MIKRKVNKKRKKMSQVYSYIAVFEVAEEGGFNVSFPALPGCVTFGNSLADAKKNAKEALALWIEEMLFQNEQLPLEYSTPRLHKIHVSVAKL